MTFGATMRQLAEERARRREARKQKLEQERDARIAAIYQRVPELADIQRRQSQLAIEMAQAILQHRASNPQDFASKGMALSMEKAQLLAKYNIDPADMDVYWDCPLCKDRGELELVKAPGDGLYGNQYYPPQKCTCIEQEEIRDMYEAAGIGGPLQGKTFETFDLAKIDPADRKYMASFKQTCEQFADAVSRGQPTEKLGLVLMGKTGHGKTHLLSAIAHRVIQARRPVMYGTATDLIELIKIGRFADNKADGVELIRRLQSVDLLVIDDLGSEVVSPFIIQEWFNLLNARINRGLPFVISTNLIPREIDDIYGDRIMSRLFTATILETRGRDMRQAGF